MTTQNIKDVKREDDAPNVDIDGSLSEEPVAELASTAGRTLVYHQLTHVTHEVNNNELRHLERKDWLLPDGRPAFSRTPTGTPFRGTLLCLLHPEHPDRAMLDKSPPEGAGLSGIICMSIGRPNQMQLVSHMQHRHPKEYEAILQVKADAREQREEAYQQLMLETQAETLKQLKGANDKE